MASTKAKKPGPPKGSESNNPDGRPPSVNGKHSVFARLDDETFGYLDELAARWSIPKVVTRYGEDTNRSEVIRRAIRQAWERK